MVTNWVFVYLVVSITPIGNSHPTNIRSLRTQTCSADSTQGIQNLQWRFYTIFAVLNLVWLPFIWYFYVETAGLSLDEIDRVFELKHASDSNMTYGQATILAREEIERERIVIGQKSHDTQEQIEQVA